MRIKTFYSKTMSEALREVKAQLGSDALLLSIKEVPCRSGAWSRASGYEVVAAIDHEEDVDVFVSGKGDRSVAEKADPFGITPVISSHEGTVTETYPPAVLGMSRPAIFRKKTRHRKIQSHTCGNTAEGEPEGHDLPFEGRDPISLYQDLVKSGVDSAVARTLLSNALELLGVELSHTRTALLRAANQALWSLVAAPATQNGLPGKKVVAFVGPAGVGKTTSIAKLAARLALQERKKVVLVTLDRYRIGAVEQLRSYAGLMAIPFRFVDQPSDLAGVIEDYTQRDFILVDTAGRSPKEMESMLSLAVYLGNSEFIERHLVLSAATKPTDMRRIMDQFEPCRPDHLLFTKLDETSTPGPILNELVRTQKAFSYYADGQSVPDDLHAVPREQIIDLIINQNKQALEG
jgi:flagellar biosynthesis protein FlhF